MLVILGAKQVNSISPFSQKIFAKMIIHSSHKYKNGLSEAAYMFYLGRNDGFCKETLSVIIQFLLCGCLCSKTIKVQLNICLLFDA